MSRGAPAIAVKIGNAVKIGIAVKIGTAFLHQPDSFSQRVAFSHKVLQRCQNNVNTVSCIGSYGPKTGSSEVAPLCSRCHSPHSRTVVHKVVHIHARSFTRSPTLTHAGRLMVIASLEIHACFRARTALASAHPCHGHTRGYVSALQYL